MSENKLETDVIIFNPTAFAEMKAKLIAGGARNLQVVSDFDRTLTKWMVNGKRGASVYGVIEESNLLSPSYHEQLRALFDHYYPIEVDPTSTIEEKIPHMVEWYTKSNGCLINEKCNIALFDEMITRANLAFREHVSEFFSVLEQNNVPLLIFSAGIANIIERIVRQFEGRLHKNLHVVGNHVITDEQGIIVAFSEPLIHTFNKNEMSLAHDKTATWFGNIKEKKNVILLGDSLGDVGMATGIKDPTVVLKIGFLNHDVEKNLERYKQAYDVLIINDGSFKFPLELLREILAQ